MYLHKIPGRIRIKTPKVKQNKRNADEVKRLLSLIYGINDVEINLVTGSILVFYHPEKIDASEIINFLHDKKFFNKHSFITNDDVFEKATSVVVLSLLNATLSAMEI
jgi:copper chaperone CopZ